MMREETEAQACPCCGGPAIYTITPPDLHWIACGHCGLAMMRHERTAALAAWNKRPAKGRRVDVIA